jgi:hypothetical protein
MASLKVFNIVAFSIQAALFTLCVVWATVEWGSLSSAKNFPLELGRYKPNNAADGKITDVSVAFPVLLLVFFTLVTAVFHFRAAFVTNNNTSESLPNRARWVEYSITATVMIVVVAMSSGVFALDTLVLIAVATACCMLCGLATDSLRPVEDASPRKMITIIGWVLIIGVFLAIAINYIPTAQAAPWFVHCIVGSMFLLYTSFGWIHAWDLGKRSTNKMKTEKLYIAASMGAKAALVLLLFSGLITRQADQDEVHTN